jgi:hypothetical protein
MSKVLWHAILVTVCLTLMAENSAVANSVWVTQWLAVDSHGRIPLFNNSGDGIGLGTPPSLPPGGKPAQMTASGLWRMETDNGPIFFELRSVKTFNSTQSSCDVVRGSPDRSGSSNGLSGSPCQH